MIALDTNMLVRALIDDHPEHRRRQLDGLKLLHETYLNKVAAMPVSSTTV